MHITDFCLFLALEKCSCLATYNYFSDDTETAPVAQLGNPCLPHGRLQVSTPRTFPFSFFFLCLRICPVAFFHCYKYVSILSMSYICFFKDTTCVLNIITFYKALDRK